VAEIDGLQLDLNTASIDELQALPWFTRQDALDIAAHRKSAEGFRSVRDLRSVNGLAADAIDAATPYLVVGRTASPSKPLTAATTVRATRSPSTAGGLSSLRLYQRIRVSRTGRWEMRLLHERDPGEALADYVSGYLSLTGAGPFTRVILGDFRPGYGQGLLLSRRTRGSASMGSARPHNPSPVGYTSSEENGAFRGLFAETVRNRFRAVAFASRSTWDAKIDSSSAAFRSGGDHASETGQAYQDALAETSGGLRLHYTSAAASIGLTGVTSRFSLPVDSIGARLTIASIDAHLRLGDTALFGESSLDRSAWIAGVRFASAGLAASAVARHYGPDFRVLRAAPFAAYSVPPANEAGVFAGIAWRPRPGLRVETSFDRHHRLIPKETPFPESGERFRFSVSTKHLTLQVSSQREDDLTSRVVGDRSRRRVRLTLSRGSLPARIRFWSELGSGSSPVRAGASSAGGLELRLDPASPLRLSFWAAAFHVTQWEARVYAFHPDVWGGSRMEVLSGSGGTSGMRLEWKGRRLRVSARLSIKRTAEGVGVGWGVQIELPD